MVDDVRNAPTSATPLHVGGPAFAYTRDYQAAIVFTPSASFDVSSRGRSPSIENPDAKQRPDSRTYCSPLCTFFNILGHCHAIIRRHFKRRVPVQSLQETLRVWLAVDPGDLEL